MILSNYSYLYDVANLAISAIQCPTMLNEPLHTIDVNLIGSRLSAKTMQVLKFVCEISFIAQKHNLGVATDIIRYEPKGATETFEELLGTMQDIYEIEPTRHNANMTMKKVKLGTNAIRVHGILSNRLKKVTKLGLARKGVKKDIQIRVFEEVTEFPDVKLISLVNQATGGAKFNINIKIANP